MEVKSDKVIVGVSGETVYGYVSNFSNLKFTMPEQVKNFVATENECSFDVNGVSQVCLRMKEKTKPTKVVIETVQGKSPLSVDMAIDISSLSDNSCDVVVCVNADVPVFLSGMVKKPLEKFVSMVAEQLCKIKEV